MEVEEGEEGHNYKVNMLESRFQDNRNMSERGLQDNRNMLERGIQATQCQKEG